MQSNECKITHTNVEKFDVKRKTIDKGIESNTNKKRIEFTEQRYKITSGKFVIQACRRFALFFFFFSHICCSAA